MVCLVAVYTGPDAKRICPSPSVAPVTGLLVMKNDVSKYNALHVVIDVP